MQSNRFSGQAILHGTSHMWISGTDLLQQLTDQRQIQFFQNASIKTVLCIPCGSEVLELGTTDSVSAPNDMRYYYSQLQVL